VYSGDESCLLQFVVSLNLKRRHLTSSQKAVVALDVLTYLELQARERMLVGHNQHTSPVQKIEQGYTDPMDGRSVQQAAQIVGTNRQYVADAKKIAADSPELLNEIKRGATTITRAKAELKLRERQKQRSELARNAASVVVPDSVKLVQGSFIECMTDLPDNSVDLIFTDPPYDENSEVCAKLLLGVFCLVVHRVY
jgi:hypothetical protein